MSISDYAELQLLDAVLNADAFSVTTVAVQLHTGEPGEAGTSNVATETDRTVATFAAAAAGACASDADITWTAVAATETYTHISLWDNATPAAGNCLWTGPLGVGTKNPAVAGADDIFLSYGHGFTDNMRVQMLALEGATLPTGINGTTLYFVITDETDSFQVSLTQGGAAVNVTAGGEAIVQRVVPVDILIGQNFTIPSGQLVVSLN